MNVKNPKINLNKSLIYFLDRTPIPFFLTHTRQPWSWAAHFAHQLPFVCYWIIAFNSVVVVVPSFLAAQNIDFSTQNSHTRPVKITFFQKVFFPSWQISSTVFFLTFLTHMSTYSVTAYRGSSLSTNFGIWKKSYYAKFVLVCTT